MIGVPEQEPVEALRLELELHQHPVAVSRRERKQIHHQAPQAARIVHPGRCGPAQVRVDDQVDRPHHGDRNRPDAQDPGDALAESGRASENQDQKQSYRYGGKRTHPRSQRRT